MKKGFLLILILFFYYTFAAASSDTIEIRKKGSVGNHSEHPIPADEPDVYYDRDAQQIIVDGMGYVSYYDVEITSQSTWDVVVSTSVNGSYDTIDISSLPDDTENGNSLNHISGKFYPMIYYSLSCSTMPFNYQGLSFGESFTTGKDYGGPVYIGNSDEAYAYESIYTLRAFINNLQNSNFKIGQAYAISKRGYDGHMAERVPLNAMSYNYLGDPSLELWTDVTCELNSDIRITRNDSTISIAIDSTEYLPCYISYFKKNGRPTYILVNTSTITLNNASSRDVIMLYRHNCIPYIAPLELQNTDIIMSKYVIANEVAAGNHVNSNRSAGDVTVKSGASYEIEAKGTVSLHGGFHVEKGATFAVYPPSF